MIRISALILILAFTSIQAEAKKKPFFLGHNLTHSTETVEEKKWIVGNYAVGFGLSDEILIATSPWILTSYSTQNLHLKYSQQINSQQRWAIMASYFDSIKSVPFITVEKKFNSADQKNQTADSNYFKMNRHQWQSYSIHSLFSNKTNSMLETYYSFKFSNYTNDEFAYSLRMDPGDSNIRNQVDISAMWKFESSESDTGAFIFEFGTIGLNYMNPYLHTGASYLFYDQNWSFQIGASFTTQFKELFSSNGWTIGKLDDRAHYSTSSNTYYTNRYYQTALHPEIQLQYTF